MGDLLVIVVICVTTFDARAMIKSTPSITLCVLIVSRMASVTTRISIINKITYSAIYPTANDTVVP